MIRSNSSFEKLQRMILELPGQADSKVDVIKEWLQTERLREIEDYRGVEVWETTFADLLLENSAEEFKTIALKALKGVSADLRTFMVQDDEALNDSTCIERRLKALESLAIITAKTKLPELEESLFRLMRVATTLDPGFPHREEFVHFACQCIASYPIREDTKGEWERLLDYKETAMLALDKFVTSSIDAGDSKALDETRARINRVRKNRERFGWEVSSEILDDYSDQVRIKLEECVVGTMYGFSRELKRLGDLHSQSSVNFSHDVMNLVRIIGEMESWNSNEGKEGDDSCGFMLKKILFGPVHSGTKRVTRNQPGHTYLELNDA